MRITSGTEEGVSHVPGPAGGVEGAERTGRRRPLPAWRPVAIIAALAGVACLAAACSSGPASPASKPPRADVGAKTLAYSKCMRSHGVRDFPDPTIHAHSIGLSIHGGPGSNLNPGSPTFKAASRACKSLAPPGLNGPQQQTAQQLATDVKFADCMRSHGYPGFPDPDGHGVFNVPGSINTSSAQFRSASNTCQSQTHIPGLSMSQHGPGSGS
jgi:hypothetical protein